VPQNAHKDALLITRGVKSKIRRVSKVSISDEIAQQIMDLIASGDLKPGQRLPSERELCKDFGAGRSSLREALRCLSIVGVLNARVGEGTSVAADGGKFLGKIIEWRMITEKHDVENLLEVRIGLEGVAAANAAIRAKQKDLEHIEELLSQMREAVDDRKQFAALDLAFHIALAKASGNAFLIDLISMIRSQLARVLQKVLSLPNAVPLSLKEHQAIFDAVNRSDAEAARQAMQAHLQGALLRHREEAGNRRSGNNLRPKTRNARTRSAASGRPRIVAD
jgi:GntR family transcriptional regulator, transcriptional repressor for pyruvate dehydrogenase complex